jgi:hypothetical protein
MAGQTERGKPMPQTVDEWRYLAELYSATMEMDYAKIKRLEMRVIELEDKLRRR